MGFLDNTGVKRIINTFKKASNILMSDKTNVEQNIEELKVAAYHPNRAILDKISVDDKNNVLYNGGPIGTALVVSTPANYISQKLLLSPAINSRNVVDVAEDMSNSNIMVQCFALLPSIEGANLPIIKQFNNADSANFFYNPNKIIFEDAIKIKEPTINFTNFTQYKFFVRDTDPDGDMELIKNNINVFTTYESTSDLTGIKGAGYATFKDKLNKNELSNIIFDVVLDNVSDLYEIGIIFKNSASHTVTDGYFGYGKPTEEVKSIVVTRINTANYLCLKTPTATTQLAKIDEASFTLRINIDPVNEYVNIYINDILINNSKISILSDVANNYYIEFINAYQARRKTNPLKINQSISNIKILTPSTSHPEKELVVASGDFTASLIDHIDYFKLNGSINGSGGIKIVCSIDGGTTWKTNDGENWIDLSISIPLKNYSSLSTAELTKWNACRDVIFDQGIPSSSIKSINFNKLDFSSIRFAYVLSKELYTDDCETDILYWSYTTTSSVNKVLTDNEVKIEILHDQIVVTPLISSDMITVNMLVENSYNLFAAKSALPYDNFLTLSDIKSILEEVMGTTIIDPLTGEFLSQEDIVSIVNEAMAKKLTESVNNI